MFIVCRSQGFHQPYYRAYKDSFILNINASLIKPKVCLEHNTYLIEQIIKLKKGFVFSNFTVIMYIRKGISLQNLNRFNFKNQTNPSYFALKGLNIAISYPQENTKKGMVLLTC